MRSKLIKKIIALSLVFSSAFVVGSNINSKLITVQADDDWDDYYDDWYDDDYYEDLYDDYYDDDWYDDDYYDDWDDYYYFRPGSNQYKYWLDRYNNFQRPSTNYNQIKSPGNSQRISSYLKNVYRNIFNREIDQQGLDYWTNKISNREISLVDFFKNILAENEFKQIAPTPQEKIRLLYKGIFEREADVAGFNYWVSQYERELNRTRNETNALRNVIDGMTSGQEFKQLLSKLALN